MSTTKPRSVKKPSEPWTQKEDDILIEIIKNNQPKKWATISKLLEEEYDIKNRSAKQCQQRWINQLQPKLKTDGQWTDSQEKIMFKYHYQYGNKWAKIANHLQGRTDNDVKNYFYCTLRRGFKKMNKFIALKKSKVSNKLIKMAVLSKCIAVAQDKFQKKIGVSEQIIQICQEIKKKIVHIAKQSFRFEGNETKVEQLIEQMIKFNKSYRKKKKAKANSKDKSKSKGKKKVDQSSQQDESQQQELEEKKQKQIKQIPIHQLFEKQKVMSSQTKPVQLNYDFQFLKSRIGSGSMDFWKIQRSGSAGSDLANNTNKQSQTSGNFQGSQIKPKTKIQSSQVSKKSSLDAPIFNNIPLTTQSIQDMFQKRSSNRLQVPNLIIPSFDLSYISGSLTTNSGDLTNILHGRPSRNYDAINPLTSQLKKIQSGDFQYFYNKQTK